MTPAEVQTMVRQEIHQMFAGADGVTFANDPAKQSQSGLFYDRFLEVMTAIHRTLAELAQRVATVEHQLYDLEQVMRQRGHAADGYHAKDGHVAQDGRPDKPQA